MYQRKGYGLRSDGHIFLPVTDTGIVWKVLINNKTLPNSGKELVLGNYLFKKFILISKSEKMFRKFGPNIEKQDTVMKKSILITIIALRFLVTKSITYIKMNRYFPWSRHHACTDGPILLILFLKCSLKSKREAHREKNFLENSEKSLKHLSLAAAAQWIK